MFTLDERQRVQDRLIAAGRDDDRIVSGALTGSAALDGEDRWSDIDLALSVSAEADRSVVIAGWTERMYSEHGAIEQLDVTVGSALYRVFLLPDLLQVDLSFWPEAEFGATGPKFRLLFGTAAQRQETPPPAAAELAGFAWLYAVHARRCIGRERWWQAELMISDARNQVLALACLRHGLPTAQGRGMDDLPLETTERAEEAIVRSLEPAELERALAALVDVLLLEIRWADSAMADRLASPLGQLARDR